MGGFFFSILKEWEKMQAASAGIADLLIFTHSDQRGTCNLENNKFVLF